MYSPHCTVRGLEVLSVVWIHSIEADAPAVDKARAILLLEERDDPALMCTPSITPLFKNDAKMLASELGQKYVTQNYPSQGTPICKLHGPSIKPPTLHGGVHCNVGCALQGGAALQVGGALQGGVYCRVGALAVWDALQGGGALHGGGALQGGCALQGGGALQGAGALQGGVCTAGWRSTAVIIHCRVGCAAGWGALQGGVHCRVG